MMESEFQVVRGRRKVRAVLTRDSVCAGDDCDAPHEKSVKISSFVDPREFARELSSGYLPSVAGIRHKWTCQLNGVNIAEISRSGIRALIGETPFAKHNRVHFVYHSAKH